MKKTHKIILLNTEDISNIGIPLGDLQYDKDGFDPHIIQCKELYIISDDEIKDGEWFINELNQVWQHNGKVQPATKSKKIVATTDKSITKDIATSGKFYEPLPQIPESFIQAYIKAYNDPKVQTITEVDLEMELIIRDTQDCIGMNGEPNGVDFQYYQIKTRPDNTVIVRETKLYNFEDLYLKER